MAAPRAMRWLRDVAACQEPDAVAQMLKEALNEDAPLVMITNRGVKVWPGYMPETLCTDHWRCRFQVPDGQTMASAEVAAMLTKLAAAGVDFIKTENLYTFDGEPGFSLGQGQ